MQQSEAGRLKCDLIGGQFLKNLSATNLLTKVAQMFGDFAPKKFKTNLFLKMARSRPFYFGPFLVTISIMQIEKV